MTPCAACYDAARWISRWRFSLASCSGSGWSPWSIDWSTRGFVWLGVWPTAARPMADGDPLGSRRSDYRGARIGAAAALVLVVVFSLVIDATSPEFEVSALVLAALLGAILTLLGLEVRSITGGDRS